jgi:hypothetical protein
MIESLYNNLLAPTYSSFQDGDIPVHAVTPSLSDRLRLLPILLRTLPLLRRYTEPFSTGSATNVIAQYFSRN